MSEFNVNTQNLRNQSENIRRIQEELRSEQENIADAIRYLRGKSGSLERISRKLDRLDDRLLEEAAKMGSMAEALVYIVNTYEKTESIVSEAYAENALTQQVNDADKNQSFLEKIRLWILEWLNMFKKEETGEQSEARRMEQEHDLFMQSEIFNLLETEAYSKETWKNASIEERKQMLTNLLREICRIMGIDVNENVNFADLGGSTRGTYSSSTNTVSINTSYLSRSDGYQVIYTMIHEMRHAYQHAAIENPGNFNVSPETIEQWKNNFSNYKSTSKGNTYEEYVAQPVEYDAKNFAKQYSDIEGVEPEYAGSW